MSEVYHIVPNNDLEEHKISCECHCNPTWHPDGFWVHHSYDGREVFERDVEYVTSLLPFMRIQTWKAARLHGIMKQFHEELMQYEFDDITKNRSAFTTLICLT